MDEPEAKQARHDPDDCDTNNKRCKSLPSTVVSWSETVQEICQSHQCGSGTADDEYARARKVQRALQKSTIGDNGRTQQISARYGPKIHLSLETLLPFNNLNDPSKGKLEDRLPPLFITDLQHLMLLALLKNFSIWTPRWCRLSRPRKLSTVVLIVLKNVSIKDFEQNPESFPFLKNNFLSCVEMVSPTQYNSSLEQDMCGVPLLISQLKCYSKREDIRNKIVKLISKPTKSSRKTRKSESRPETMKTDLQEKGLTASEVSQTCCLENREPQTIIWEDNFPRTSLLLSTVQLVEEGYPLPVDVKNKRYSDYAFTKDRYIPATESSPMFAVDCEMKQLAGHCFPLTHHGCCEELHEVQLVFFLEGIQQVQQCWKQTCGVAGWCQTVQKDFELTRVSVVNEQKEVVYDQLVKPYNKITNYLTPYSGMTAELLSPVTKRVEDVHKDLKALLPPDAILCGQSLWNDLNALKMFHPFVIDTSIIFNQSGDKKVKCGLRKLAFNFLGQKIQGSKNGHCSIEDAKATMDLVKLKLSKDIEFGDAMLGGVYFPNIKTYFENPSKAQNVEETFSAHPVSLPTDSDMCLHTSHPSTKDKESNALVCMQSSSLESDPSVTHTNESIQLYEDGQSRSKELEEAKLRGSGDSQLDEGVLDCIEAESERVEETRQHCEEGVNQREVFFQREGNMVMFNFFELLADNNNTVGLVGSKELVSRLGSCSKLECVEATDSAETCTKAVKVSQDKDFTWVELSSFASALASDAECCRVKSDAEKRTDLLAQLDNQVQHIVTKLQAHSLVTVVMTGQYEEGQHLNAATFLKMT